MGEQKEIEERNQTQQPLWLVNNMVFCYEDNKHTGNESEKKKHFLQHKGKNSANKEAYTDESKSTGRDTSRRSPHSHSWNDSSERDKRKIGHKMGNIYPHIGINGNKEANKATK